MSGIVGSYFNTRGSGVVAKLGTDGQVFTSTGAGLSQGFEAAGGGKFESALLHVRDEKSSGSTGGSSTSGSYQTRTLNTVITNEISGASLSSNQIVLPVGTFYIQARANVRAAGSNKCKLYNITDSADTILGSNQLNTSGTGEQDDSTIYGRFTIDSADTFELQSRVTSNQAGDGYGLANSFGDVEVYAEALIWKVA